MSARYPVLYLQHGGGEDKRGWPVHGRVCQILDNLIAEKKAEPMLVVMARGYARKPGEEPGVAVGVDLETRGRGLTSAVCSARWAKCFSTIQFR